MAKKKAPPPKEKEPCNACGSTDYTGTLKTCPYCDGTKCSHCNMGDDVECPACENEGDMEDE